MELEFSPWLTILLSFSVFTIFLLKVSSSSSKIITKTLPPGPRKLPLIGNLHHFATYYPLHRTLRDLALKYGPSIMHLQLGQVSTIVVSSPQVAKEIMKTHDINFASRPSILASEIICYGSTDIVFAPYGEYWRNQVISRASLGNKFNEQAAAFVSILQECIVLGSGFDICDVYPSIKLLRKISLMGYKLEKLHVKLNIILDDIINKYKLTGSQGKKYEDLLDVLLKYQDDGCELPLTTDNIKAILIDLFTGGTETTASTIEWALSEMLKLPRVLKKAQDEVRKSINEKGGYIDESYLHELKYLKLVIKETLRMHPPIPLLLPRENNESCEIDGYEIPFGSGRRMCAGMNFGLANMELPLAMLLYHFDWILPNGMKPEELDMNDTFGATTRRKTPLYLIPVVKIPLLVK